MIFKYKIAHLSMANIGINLHIRNYSGLKNRRLTKSPAFSTNVEYLTITQPTQIAFVQQTASRHNKTANTSSCFEKQQVQHIQLQLVTLALSANFKKVVYVVLVVFVVLNIIGGWYHVAGCGPLWPSATDLRLYGCHSGCRRPQGPHPAI